MSAGWVPRHTARIIKIGIAVGLTAYLLWQSDPAKVAETTARADWRWLLLAVGLVIVDRGLMAWRWMALLDDSAGLPPARRLLRIFFVSTFLGTFLPGGIGGDAVRAWSLSRENVAGSRALASVLMDRLLGTIGLVLLAAAGIFTAASVLPDGALTIAVVMAALGCLGASMLVYSRTLESLLQRLARQLPARLMVPASRLVVAIRAYSTRHAALVGVLILSVAVNVLRVLQAYTLGQSLALEAPLFAYAAFVPIIVLVMQLPISIYGLGTTQLAFGWFFSRVGTTEPEAFALSVLFLGLGLVGALPGGLLYMFEPQQATAPRGVL